LARRAGGFSHFCIIAGFRLAMDVLLQFFTSPCGPPPSIFFREERKPQSTHLVDRIRFDFGQVGKRETDDRAAAIRPALARNLERN
jgi:hypothetical protein